MIIKESYNYRLISKEEFDIKYLETKTFKNTYRKYKIVKYKKDNDTCFIESPKECIDKLNDIIAVYDAEKIISNCVGFDSRYTDLTYYRIDDLYFIEFLRDEESNSNENGLVKDKLLIKGLLS